MHLLPPPLDYWYTSFFFLTGPGPLHEIVVSTFSRSPLGRANTLSFLFLLLTPGLNVPPPSPCFLALAFSLFLSLILPLSCTPKLFCGQHISLIFSYILPYVLYYAIPPYSSSPFCCFLPHSPISPGWQSLFGMLLIFYSFSNFSRLYLF